VVGVGKTKKDPIRGHSTSNLGETAGKTAHREGSRRKVRKGVYGTTERQSKSTFARRGGVGIQASKGKKIGAVVRETLLVIARCEKMGWGRG